MSTRFRWISGAAFLVGALFFGLALSRPSIGRSQDNSTKSPAMPETTLPIAKPTTASQVSVWADSQGPGTKSDGGYHVVGSGTLSYVVVMNTRSGDCWALYAAEPNPEKRWVYLGSPASPKDK